MHPRFRQMARLEARIASLLERYGQSVARVDESVDRSIYAASHIKICNLAFITLYGEPKIDEPLLAAWERCCQSDVVREKNGRFEDTPFTLIGAVDVADFFLGFVLYHLPGDNPLDQLDRIFAKAPPWLCWFTHADFDARILGVTLPDLSSVSRFQRGRATLYRLPLGPFECHRLPDGVDEPLMVEDEPTVAALEGVPLDRRQRILEPSAGWDLRLKALLDASKPKPLIG